jgi:predicted cupin superfamily sugar epimerase
MKDAQYYLQHLQMTPHPEGGHFCETFRSDHQLIFPGFTELRSYTTSIFFLLKKGEVSAMHRIKSDEIWCHHDGGTLIITEIDENGQTLTTQLGKDIHLGQKLQHVVKAERWFGAQPADGSEFCLVGCQVTPGFDFLDFELKK